MHELAKLLSQAPVGIAGVAGAGVAGAGVTMPDLVRSGWKSMDLIAERTSTKLRIAAEMMSRE